MNMRQGRHGVIDLRLREIWRVYNFEATGACELEADGILGLLISRIYGVVR